MPSAEAEKRGPGIWGTGLGSQTSQAGQGGAHGMSKRGGNQSPAECGQVGVAGPHSWAQAGPAPSPQGCKGQKWSGSRQGGAEKGAAEFPAPRALALLGESHQSRASSGSREP